MNARAAKLLFLPYMGFGLFVAVGLTSKNGFKSLLSLLLTLAVVCGLGLVLAIVRTTAGRRFLGMDRGLWIAGSVLACIAGAAIGYVALQGV